MSGAIITVILTQVSTILEHQIRRELGLICSVEKNLKKLESEFNSIKAVLGDAERRQIKEESVKIWLEKLKDVSYETEDVLSEWITTLQKESEIEDKFSQSRKLFSVSCFGFDRIVVRRETGLKIRRINERLMEIGVEKDRYKFNEFSGVDCFSRPKSASYIDVNEVEGREIDRKTLINKLVRDGAREGEKGINVISVVGLGGIGKTTLVQVVYGCSEVCEHFDRRIWVCVSDLFDEVRIAKAILEDIEGSAPYLFELETVVRKIRNYVEGERFLLVLDDVWTNDFRKWEHLFNSLKAGASGSTIVVTTRNESVAKVMGSRYQLRLGSLSDVDSWTLFEKIVFFERKSDQRLEDLGKMIAKKCKGLPLAIKTIGSLMRFKNTLDEWKDVLESDFWALEEAEGLFPPLMLSYYDLPSPIKRCFLFCAFFPKDHVIEASNLIQLWMAHGYLVSSENVDIEVIGQEYLQNLAMRSFFQEIVKDKNSGAILTLKMHDMIHDFANYLTKNECSVIEYNTSFQHKMESSYKRARHLTLVRAEDTQFPNIPNVEKLHTFWVQSFHDSPTIISQLDRVDPDLIRRLAGLRALDLSRNRIGELPKDIGNLIKLKYLDLSHNPFGELPETLCDLYNLQTLKLSSCDHLRKLPSRVSKLVNLRHLEIDRTDSLKTLPKGIASLKKLRILTKFVIIRANDRGFATCGLEDLKNLNNLRGCLKIEGLGYAVDANEARKAELRKKIHLSDLEMDFTPSIQSSTSQDKIIEALEVHENLQSLQITSYGGENLPDWIMKLTNLKKLFLQDCHKCNILPYLGGLPSLVTLHLEGMKGITSLALDFLDEEATSAFPNLKKLKISNMENWEEWNLKNENVDIMPRLRCLKISRCKKLRALPIVLLQRLPIRKLRIDDCPLLQQHYNKETGNNWSKISHISKIRVS